MAASGFLSELAFIAIVNTVFTFLYEKFIVKFLERITRKNSP